MTSRHHYQQQRTLLTTTRITPSETSAVHHLLHGIASPSSIANNQHSHFHTDYNSTGSLSSSSTSSSSSSTSSHSSSAGTFHWSVQMNEDQSTEGTIVERLEQNGDKFQTPYRDENAKNEWLSTKAREILGPTNRSSLLDSSPFSETANANLLNPKSPSNDLKNRSTIRLPSRNNTNTSSSSLTVHNNQTASNLNNVNNNNSNNNLLISQSSNSSQLARINASSSSNRSSSTTKNTSPPVKPVQASSKPISHSASTPSLPVNKPSKKSDTDLFKVFKQMQLKPFINRLDDIRSDTPVEFSKPKPVTLTTATSNHTFSTSSSHHSKPTKSTNLRTIGDIELSEDDGEDPFSIFDRSLNSGSMADSSHNNSSSNNNNKNHQIDQRTKPAVNQRINTNINKSAKSTETKPSITTNSNNNNVKKNGVTMNGETNNTNNRISTVTTPTAFQQMNENPIENETTNAALQQVKPLVTDQTLSKAPTTIKKSLDDSSSSSSSDDEDSGSSSSSSSSSGSSSSSDSDDDDSSSSSSSSSSEGECSSSSNESDVETTGKDVTTAAAAASQKKSKISNGKKIVNSVNNTNPSTLSTISPTTTTTTNNHKKNFNLIANKKTELDNTALTKKLTQVTNSAACVTSASAKVNLNKEDLSFNLSKTTSVLDQNVDSNNKQSDDSAETSSDKTLDEEGEEEDEQNITLTGMIEKIVSPNKQKNATSSSSASSSKNTSPQLPIFSNTASVSAQLVTTINSGSKQFSLVANSNSNNRSGSASNNSANPSPFTDTEYAQCSNNNETSGITFTLSDDEMDGEDSNASNYNMQTALSCQITTGVDETSQKVMETTSNTAEDECKKEAVVAQAGSSFQSVTKTSGTLNLSNSSFKQHNNETNGNKDNKLPFSNNSSTEKGLKKASHDEDAKSSSTDNSSRKLSNSSSSKRKSDLNLTESNSASTTKLALTSDNFKQQPPKPDHLKNLKKSDSEGFANGPLSAGFVPSSQGYMFNKAKSVTPPFNKLSPSKLATKETDSVKEENVHMNGSSARSTPISNATAANPSHRKDLEHKPKERKKQHKSKLVVTSSSDDDEESNEDEFKDELNQYLKKRPLDSSDDIGHHSQKEDTLSKHTKQHKQHRSATPLSNTNNNNNTTNTATSSLTPSMQHQTRTSSNSLTTPTTAPSTPALFEQAPTPNPTPTNTSKPLKASSNSTNNQVNKLQNGSSAKKQRSGKFDEENINDSALTELLTSKEKKLEEELNMLNKIAEKTRGLSSSITPTSNLKREKLSPSSQYLQQSQQLVVNNANIVKSQKSEPYQKQPKLEATTNGNSISSDQIQYTADGRPKLIVSIELDLIKILNNQFGLPPITSPSDQYMDHDLKMSELDQMASKHNKLNNNVSYNSPSKTTIPSNNSHKRKEEKTHSPACPSSDTDDVSVSSSHKSKKRSDQSSSHKSSSSSSHKSSESSSHHSSRKSLASDSSKVSSSSSTSKGSNHDNGANTSQSLKRSIQSSAGSEDLESSQRSATKKQKFIESSSKEAQLKSSAINDKPVSPAVNNSDNNVRQMKNKAASFSTGNAPKVGADGVKSKSNLGASNPTETDTKPKKLGDSKYGQYSIDFSTLEEQELHRRGKQKKHEADQEKDKFKKSIAYMEAVCYFCLCAISQYRLKKAAVNPTSNKSSFDLLNDTYQLLKYLHEKVLKSVDNDIFIKKFKVLSNWMESFINRWLWLMSLGDIRKLKESIGKQTSLMAAASVANAVASSSSQKASSQAGEKITSPNELPPPSPASSIGSSAGSLTGHNKDQAASASQTTEKDSSQPQQQQTSQVEIMQKMVSLYERFSRLNDYNLRSQNFWDSNEMQISEVDYLNEFRETIKKQVQKELHIDCEAELFANYIITGLQLFKLKMF